MANSSLEKLRRIKEVEEKARSLLDEAGRKSGELLAEARLEASRRVKEEETRAREDGNTRLAETLEQAQIEADGISDKANEEVEKLIAAAAPRREKAVVFLLERLEKAGD
jgi:vacuolar-type H+-ATPase subunit H